MARVRPAVYAALMLCVLVAASAAAAIPRPLTEPLAAVGWPPSAGLIVAEVVTGGASASDEYIELANAGQTPADLAGLEVAYATSSGSTVTRKAAWTASLPVAPGQHLLLANSSGVYAPLADAVYSGGLAATGGAIILRATGGAVIDAVGWGDATSSFVEGAAAPAPAAGQSIERRPGGSGGNTVDTNSNAADFVVNPTPNPQNLAAPPAPSPSASASPAPSPIDSPVPSPTEAPSDSPSPTVEPSPTVQPTASATPTPTPAATGSPSAIPSPEPSFSPTAAPTFEPAAEPTPTPAPTASPTAEPSTTPAPTSSPTAEPSTSATPSPTGTPAPSATPEPTPSPSPTPAALPIGDVRQLADGAPATVEGILTTALGGLESGRTGFIQDATGGIALYLDAPLAMPTAAGSVVRVPGVVGSRYGQRTLRVAAADIAGLGLTDLPAPVDVATGSAVEPLEGWRIRVTGTVTEAPSALADGLGVTVDDGSGPLRLVIGPDALGVASIQAGQIVTATGPLGQRDSTGTGVGGYRLFATLPGEAEVLPPPTPSPTPTPSQPSETASPVPTETAPATPTPAPSVTPSPTGAPSSGPSPTGSPAPTLTPGPTATPAPSVEPVTVGAARTAAVGATVAVRGVVIAEAGRLGTPPLFAIGDSTGGLPVRLADGMAAPGRGLLVEARGVIAAPYGQTELRLAPGGLAVVGADDLPSPLTIATGAVGEAVEGRLVTVAGVITTGAAKATSGDLSLVVRGADGVSLKVYIDGSAGLDAGRLKKGLAAAFTGIVGQHASRKGALDGYRLWLRDAADIVPSSPSVSPAPPASAWTASAAPTTPPIEPIATARVRDGATVTVLGTVTADRTLLDASGRRAVIEDGSGAIELYLAAPDAVVRVGVRIRVTGVVGRAWGAPRLRVDSYAALDSVAPPVTDLRAAPGPATEWRLVRLAGTVSSVHRSGDRWVAELATSVGIVPVEALSGARIPAAAIAVGRAATVTGIVKRPYPTATDRRYAVLPRSASDIVLGPAASGPGSSMGAAAGGPGAQPAASGAPPADLRDLAARVGDRVRVAGLVTDLAPGGFRLDDGTASTLILLEGDASDLAAVVGPGDALDATGTVELRDGPTVVVRDAADVVLVGDLGVDAASLAPGLVTALALGSPGPSPAFVSADRAPASSVPAGAFAVIGAALALAAASAALGARGLQRRRLARLAIRRRLAVWAGQQAATRPGDG